MCLICCLEDLGHAHPTETILILAAAQTPGLPCAQASHQCGRKDAEEGTHAKTNRMKRGVSQELHSLGPGLVPGA